MSSKRQAMINHLDALIASPKTGDNERDTAQRALARLLAADLAEPGRPNPYARTYGAKATDDYIESAKLAAMVRADIALALKVAKKVSSGNGFALATLDPFADLPAGLKITVRKEDYSMGRSIDVHIRNVPADWWTQSEADDYGDTYRIPGPRLAALGAELHSILHAYNYDGSDSMTDYYDVNFYGHVHADGQDIR